MNEFSERISFLIDSLGLKKTAFAARINVSQAFVSQLCAGKKQPSDRTISDICREFNVNKEWLLTGKGKMFCAKEKSEEISIFFEKVLQDEDAALRKRLIFSLAQLDESDWEILEKIAFKITNMHFKEKLSSNYAEETAEEILPTVEEAERNYIKKTSCSVQKTTSSAFNTTKDDAIKKISDGLV